jgi:hypothetical protein
MANENQLFHILVIIFGKQISISFFFFLAVVVENVGCSNTEILLQAPVSG